LKIAGKLDPIYLLTVSVDWGWPDTKLVEYEGDLSDKHARELGLYKSLAESRGLNVRIFSGEGSSVGKVVLDTVAKFNVDVVVMGRERHLISSSVTSVTQYVLENLKSATLIVVKGDIDQSEAGARVREDQKEEAGSSRDREKWQKGPHERERGEHGEKWEKEKWDKEPHIGTQDRERIHEKKYEHMGTQERPESKYAQEKQRTEQEYQKADREYKNASDRERAEREMTEREKIDKERAEREKWEKESSEKEHRGQVDKLRAEKERAEKERAEKGHQKSELEHREKEDKMRTEKERTEKELRNQQERERAEREMAEKERCEKDKFAKEKLEKEKLEREAKQKPSYEKETEQQSSQKGTHEKEKTTQMGGQQWSQMQEKEKTGFERGTQMGEKTGQQWPQGSQDKGDKMGQWPRAGDLQDKDRIEKEKGEQKSARLGAHLEKDYKAALEKGEKESKAQSKCGDPSHPADCTHHTDKSGKKKADDKTQQVIV